MSAATVARPDAPGPGDGNLRPLPTTLAAAAEPDVQCIRRPNSTWTRCRCPKCVRLNFRQRKANVRAGGRRVTSDQAWAVLDRLVARGWSTAAIESACGLIPDSLSRPLLEAYPHRSLNPDRPPRRRRLGARKAAAIVNHGRPTVGRLDATGTRRRLRALARYGYTGNDIADASGASRSQINVLRSGSQTTVTAALANMIADTYDRLIAGPPGKNSRAMNLAETAGWPGPDRWAGRDLDDLAAEPAPPLSQPRRRRYAPITARLGAASQTATAAKT